MYLFNDFSEFVGFCETWLNPDDHGDHVIAVTADFQACIEDGTVSQIVRQRTLAATAALTLT